LWSAAHNTAHLKLDRFPLTSHARSPDLLPVDTGNDADTRFACRSSICSEGQVH
jgi:hypothetical protein